MPETRVTIAHPDGRRYSTTPAAFERLYAPAGFAVEGETTDEDFVAAVPRPRRATTKRSRARAGRSSRPAASDRSARNDGTAG